MDKITAFNALVYGAFAAAKHAHACAFSDPEKGTCEDKVSALSYAAACTAKYSAAEAMYWCSPELADDTIPTLFAKFDSFTEEIRSDYRTDHPRQWVDLIFSELADLYANFECRMKHR